MVTRKMVDCKQDAIDYIDVGLGSEGSAELAERIYDCLRAEDKINLVQYEVSEFPDDFWLYAEQHNLLSSNKIFCCICGDEISEITSENETGYLGDEEHYACASHTEDEHIVYCENESTPKFSSRTGKQITESN